MERFSEAVDIAGLEEKYLKKKILKREEEGRSEDSTIQDATTGAESLLRCGPAALHWNRPALLKNR
jgi:hypothetical protein